MKKSIRQKLKNKESDVSYLIDFEPIGLRGQCISNRSLLACARHLGVDLVNLCGGVGKCGRCIVRIIEGPATPLTETEKKSLSPDQMKNGCRLACEAIPLGDLKVAVPPDSLTSPQRTQVESIESPVVPQPVVKWVQARLQPRGTGDLSSDYQRLIKGINEKCPIEKPFMDIEVLRGMPDRLRTDNGNVQVVFREKEIVGLAGVNTRPLGVAIDLGTTKIAAYLVDLETGKTLASKGEMNPQINYGEDIIARFVYAQASPGHAARLQKIIVETLNQMIAGLCDEAGASSEDIFEVVAVCNTAMHHLFLGLPTEPLSRSPYTPVIDSEMDVKAHELGLNTASGAYVHLPPNIAGYVGSDHVAMLLAVSILEKDGVVLALDIGTNTEICLSNNGRLSSLSCASGPAFEGAHIQYGMRAGDGAIENVRIDNHTVIYQTIGGRQARGFCGSGILDLFAGLYKAGALGQNGRMADNHPLIRNRNGSKEFVLAIKGHNESEYNEITFSQKDVREIQLAKGAISAGVQVLLKENRLREEDIDQIVIAGAFGSYIDVRSAKAIGMLPNIPEDRFIQVGNAAGLGSRLALISKSKREEAIHIAQQVNYIELATYPNFSMMFAEAMYLEAPADNRHINKK